MNNCSYIKNKELHRHEERTEVSAHEVSLDTLFELSEFFKFFGDTTRIRIIHLMLSGEISVNDIAEKLNLEQSVVSHQWRSLRTANWVKPRRAGRKMF